jgi:hypothetical protein
MRREGHDNLIGIGNFLLAELEANQAHDSSSVTRSGLVRSFDG